MRIFGGMQRRVGVPEKLKENIHYGIVSGVRSVKTWVFSLIQPQIGSLRLKIA